jgi:hypothetical protein
MDPAISISHSFLQYLKFLQEVIEKRLQHYFAPEPTVFNMETVTLPKASPAPLSTFIRQHRLTTAEIIVLLVALAPHLSPVFFDTLINHYIPGKGDFPQLGGLRGQNYRGFMPTGETVLFLLAGNDLEKRLTCQQLFDPDRLFDKMGVLWLEEVAAGEPRMSGKLILSPEYLELFTSGKVSYPRLSMDFPAQLLTTEQEWEDLVLHSTTRKQIEELQIWVNHYDTLMKIWGMAKKLKPGYRALFHGPPGTGKTLTASMLGKYTGKAVFRIDLSLVVSKYIGETEKNLARLFAKAENKDWILFFDEADALFGKRTAVRDAHDKYANQEASYLLQRVEQYDGLVILATNFKNNIDEAFMRRFQSHIYFPMPNAEERLQLWTKAFPARASLNGHNQLDTLARKYELSGSGIMNVVQYACLQAISHQSEQILPEYLLAGIRLEYAKENRVW